MISEAYDGPADPGATWFADNEAEGSIKMQTAVLVDYLLGYEARKLVQPSLVPAFAGAASVQAAVDEGLALARKKGVLKPKVLILVDGCVTVPELA